jgi:hypothetical protein
MGPIIQVGGGRTDAGGPSATTRLTASVMCLLSAGPVPVRSVRPPAEATEGAELDCNSSPVNPLATAWISAC